MLDRPAAKVLDRAFQALADSGRRQLLDRLVEGPASVSELARPMRMTLAAVLQHVQVLEASGLAESRKVGRVRICTLNEQGLRSTQQWLSDRRSIWQLRLDRLGTVVDEHAEPPPAPPSPTHRATSKARHVSRKV